MNNQFLEKLYSDKIPLGTLVTIGHPSISEILSMIGFDWLFIDMEHTTLDLQITQSLVQSMAKTCSAIIRVPWNDHVWIKRVLELGPDGIIIPQIKTAEEAEAAVRACKYPPEGIRGAGSGRAQLYGINFQQYVESANDSLAIILQIEHIEGVTNIDAILEIPGITAILVGPYDLSGSLGILGKIDDSRVTESVLKVKDACKKRKIPIGIFTMDDDKAVTFVDAGFNYIAVGIDIAFMWKNAHKTVNKLKPNE